MATSRFLVAVASAARRGASALLRSRMAGPAAKPARGPVPASTPVRRTGGSDGVLDGVLDGVVYAPRRDGDADPGEVVWAWIPYEDDPSQGKDRPALAIGYDGPLLAVAPLTSKDQSGRRDAFALGSGPWDPAGRPSWVNLDRVVGVDPGAVRREGAALDRARFDAVVRRLEALHGSPLRLTR
jgi:hypothetical protein